MRIESVKHPPFRGAREKAWAGSMCQGGGKKDGILINQITGRYFFFVDVELFILF